MNTLYVTDAHLQVIRDACEVYSRMSNGQLSIAIDVMGSNLDSDIIGDRQKAMSAERAYRELFPRNQVTKRNRMDAVAWEISTTIRQELSYRGKPQGGSGVCFDDPFNQSGIPLPIIIPNYKQNAHE